MWKELYLGIRDANNVIANVPEIDMDEELKNRFAVTIDEVEIIKEDVVFKVPKNGLACLCLPKASLNSF